MALIIGPVGAEGEDIDVTFARSPEAEVTPPPAPESIEVVEVPPWQRLGISKEAWQAFRAVLAGEARPTGVLPAPALATLSDEGLFAPVPTVTPAPPIPTAPPTTPEPSAALPAPQGQEPIYTTIPAGVPAALCITIKQSCIQIDCTETSEHLKTLASMSLADWGAVNGALGVADKVPCICPKQDEPRLILLFGYWPPTDVGIPARHGMLWNWGTLQENYDDSGYNVLAISPRFMAPLAVVGGVPSWGQGEGRLQVDYMETASDFWRIARTREPIAIMSFSRGKPGKQWELEAGARNLVHGDWRPDFGGDRPAIGGSAQDRSPYRGEPPKPGDPPDPTLDAGNLRFSNLPMTEIEAELKKTFRPADLEPGIDPSGDGGAFLSEYMAYLVEWYRDFSGSRHRDAPDKPCLIAGHTHVGIDVDPGIGEDAVEIQLRILIDRLLLAENKMEKLLDRVKKRIARR